MRIAGHSTITISQKYVQSSNEAMERPFDRLETFNARVERERAEKHEQAAKSSLPATVSATLPEPI